MTDPAYERIKRRHPDIPQDPLPLELPTQPTAVKRDENRRKSAPSVRYADCPKCLADKPTGVIRGADGSEIFRAHNKTLGKGRRVPCPGSGQIAPPAKTL